MTVKIYINNKQVTLFEDEGISITSSVLDIEDITKNTTDYSKTFTVPANEKNNYIFKHYYNANIDNLFDARVTVDGRIELDGFIFRTGKFVLRSVNLKQGVASSYTINFWGNLVSLVDLVGDDLLADLDLSVYNHTYIGWKIKQGLETFLIDENMVYTPIAKKQYYYDSGVNMTAEDDITTNIAYNGATGFNGMNWDELKPSLKLIKILEAIESKYSLEFSRQFFGTDTFTELFMWLNNDGNLDGMGGKETGITWTAGNSPYISVPAKTHEYPTENNPPDADNVYFKLKCTVTPASGYEEIPYTLRQDYIGTTLAEKTQSGTGNLSGTAVWIEGQNPFIQIQWTVECSQKFEFTASLTETKWLNGFPDAITNSSASLQEIDSFFEVQKNIPEMSVIDFLKGIFQAFKLVIIPLADETIYVNTLTGYYTEGALLDLTKYIDSNKLTVNRGNILNKINYKFQETQTILNQQFTENNAVSYGDEELILKDDNGKLLQGETVNVALPFEIILFERLFDINDSTETNIQTGAITDKDRKPVNPKAVIHYVSNQSTSAKPVAFIDENGTKISLNISINVPMHSTYAVSPLQPSDVFLFSAEFSTWDSNLMTETLYAKYHAPYITDIFSPKRRNYEFRAILPLRALLEITLNDVIKIGYNYFRIDNFTINTLTGETNLKLINSENITVQSFSVNTTDIFLTNIAQIYSGYVTNLLTYTYQEIDTGSGTSWLTVSDNGISNILFTVSQNSGVTRQMQVKLIKDGTLEEILFTITQAINNLSPTVDSTIITVDNTNITI